jgi:hypothetical protein
MVYAVINSKMPPVRISAEMEKGEHNERQEL